MSKTVAQICFSSSWGGLEMSALNWARQFQQHGYNSLLICKANSPLHHHAKELSLEVLALDFTRIYFNLIAIYKVRSFLKKTGVEVIFTHQLKDLWILTPALWRLPKIQSIGFARMFLKDIDKKDFLHTLLYRRLSHLIVLTESQKRELLKCLPLPKEKYKVIPNFVDTKVFRPLSEKSKAAERLHMNIPEEALIIGYLGRLDLQKGILEFLEAANIILKQYEHVYFVVVGGFTQGEEDFGKQIKEKMEALNSDRFLYFPHRNNVGPYLQALNIFVMPSYEEAFGKVLIESMACGTPVVSTRAGGVPNIVSDGIHGILVPPQSASALAEALVHLIQNPTLLKQFGEACRSTAEENYDKNKVFRKVEVLLR